MPSGRSRLLFESDCVLAESGVGNLIWNLEVVSSDNIGDDTKGHDRVIRRDRKFTVINAYVNDPLRIWTLGPHCEPLSRHKGTERAAYRTILCSRLALETGSRAVKTKLDTTRRVPLGRPSLQGARTLRRPTGRGSQVACQVRTQPETGWPHLLVYPGRRVLARRAVLFCDTRPTSPISLPPIHLAGYIGSFSPELSIQARRQVQ